MKYNNVINTCVHDNNTLKYHNATFYDWLTIPGVPARKVKDYVGVKKGKIVFLNGYQAEWRAITLARYISLVRFLMEHNIVRL